MAYDIEITQEAPRPIAATTIRTTLGSIGADIGTGFQALMPVLAREGIEPAGPPLIVYHDVIEADTPGALEICVPIDSAVLGDADVYGRELEGGAVATTMHRGPYEEIGAAYDAVMTWIADHSYEIAGPPREIYLNDPQVVPAEELLTQVQFPVSST